MSKINFEILEKTDHLDSFFVQWSNKIKLLLAFLLFVLNRFFSYFYDSLNNIVYNKNSTLRSHQVLQHFYLLMKNVRCSTQKILPLRSEKAGRFETLLGFSRSDPIVT